MSLFFFVFLFFNTKGLGKSGFSFYIRPHQLIHFGQHDHKPESTGTTFTLYILCVCMRVYKQPFIKYPHTHTHTDWQDLFFDLLFVAGAFQTGSFLSVVLKANDEFVLKGVLWSFAISLTLAQQWFMKMLLAARFGYSSLFHYCIDSKQYSHLFLFFFQLSLSFLLLF